MGDVVPLHKIPEKHVEAYELIKSVHDKLELSHIVRLLLHRLDISWTTEEVLAAMKSMGIESKCGKNRNS